MELSLPLLLNGIERLSAGRVCIIGDIMVDRYIFGRMTRISPEAPVPVVEVDIDREEGTVRPGGAANVAVNVTSLKGKALLVGVAGDDREGEVIREVLRKSGVDTGGIITERGRPTTVKTRIISRNQQVARYDVESRRPVGGEALEKMIQFLKGFARDFDHFIISDYGKGVITGRIMEWVRGSFTGGGRRVVIDPLVRNRELYRGAWGMTPNRGEGEALSGLKRDEFLPQPSPFEIVKSIRERMDVDTILLTLGEEGMFLLEREGDGTHIPALAREVYDVTGAGDTVIAVFTLALSAGLPPSLSAHLSNIAAGIVVGKMGTTSPTFSEMEDSVRRNFVPVRSS